MTDSASDGRWECLSSEKVLRTPFFTLRLESYRLPDGAVKDAYYVLDRPDGVIVCSLTADGQVPLVRQYRPPLKQMELGLPTGLVEEGEDPERAARRELSEETGYAGGEWEHLATLSSSPSLKSSRAHLYLARGVELRAGQDPDEFERLEVITVAAEKLEGMVSAGELVSAPGAAAVMLALRRLEDSG